MLRNLLRYHIIDFEIIDNPSAVSACLKSLKQQGLNFIPILKCWYLRVGLFLIPSFYLRRSKKHSGLYYVQPFCLVPRLINKWRSGSTTEKKTTKYVPKEFKISTIINFFPLISVSHI